MADLSNIRSQEYSTNLELLSQQMTPLLANYATTQNMTGAKAVRMLSQVAKTQTQDITTSATPAMNIDVTLDGRWVYSQRKGWGTVCDDLELLQSNIAPQGAFVRSAVAELNRNKDQLFIQAFFGTAKTGETGSTSTSFDSNNQVAYNYATTTSLTVAKIAKAYEILQTNTVNLSMEEAYLAVSPKQWNDLANITTVTSADYTRGRTVESGKLPKLFGFNIIVSNELPTDASGYRRCPFWVASGMGANVWQDIKGVIRKRSDLFAEPDYAEAFMQIGYTRLEEAKCGEIKCVEA